ncbi:hypothetical protein ACNI3K_00460 [Demequina sp. SO4-13]
MAPQLRFYAAERAGATAIINAMDSRIVGWLERDGEFLRARRGRWRSLPAETISTVITLVAAHEDALAADAA